MKPDTYKLLEQCIEIGTALGLQRAHKHNDNPTAEDYEAKIHAAIMEQICEWFHFDDIH
jgi:hypothetical protein